MFSWQYAPLVLALVLRAAAIDVCPRTPTTYTGANGAKYAYCSGTDLQGASVAVIDNIATIQACVAACDRDGRCTQAVYDGTRYCHIKAKGLPWVENGAWNVITLANDVKELDVIARCPFTTSTHQGSNGQVYTICPDSDFRGASTQVITGITTVQLCASRCASTAGCTKAVFDTVGSVCHIKTTANDALQVWNLNKQFWSIQIMPTLNPATQGQWSDLIRLPLIPVGAYAVPAFPQSNSIMVYSSFEPFKFGGANGRTQFATYNYVTGQISRRTVSETGHDMFCPGMSVLGDGRLLITGGSNAEVTSIYDPVQNAFTRGANMRIPRGYQSSCTLSDGKVFTMGGSWSGGIQNKPGEVYDSSSNTWTLLAQANPVPAHTADAGGLWRSDNHMGLFGWRNGSVFQAGPSRNMNWYGTSGTGSQTPAGTRPGSVDQMCGINVMYEPGKILWAAGSPSYENSDAVTTAYVTTLGNPGAAVTSQRVADMNFRRGYANAAVLPNGHIVVTGGQLRSLVFTDTAGVLAAETYDPVRNTWTRMASEAAPRNYHSVSLLLGDGRVMTGGGGLCWTGGGCAPTADHPDIQIFSPPYLFNSDGSAATRPVISSVSSTAMKFGSTFTVTMSNTNAATFALVRLGSATHSINSDQRRIPLTGTRSSATWTITLSNDPGVLLPGYYYLFAMTSTGTPSIARTVRITL